MFDPKNYRILVVDDELDLRDAIAFDFKRKGYQVFVASNGTDAFEILKTEKVDVILSDMRMPGGDGMSLLKNIKTMDPHTPVLMFITGFSDVTTEDAYNEGADAIFAKPFDRKTLQSAVIQALTSKEMLWKAKEGAELDLKVEVNFQNFEKAAEAKLINLGRGGMFISFKNTPDLESQAPELGASIDFKIHFEAAQLGIISGAGLIRWTREKGSDQFPAGLGVEFTYLDDSCREQVIQAIHLLKTKSFIPKT